MKIGQHLRETLPFLVQCKSTHPFFETIAAFNCQQAADAYVAECSKANPAYTYKVEGLPPIPHGSVVEKMIVGRLVADLLAADLLISVYDGEETTVRRSADAKTIFEALASTDSDTLLIFRPDDPKRIGLIWLVWGNDHDIISDHTDNETIRSFVDPVCDFAEGLRDA